MNTAAYVNRFSEIANLPKDEQLAVLEQARYTAFTRLKLAGRSALYMLAVTIIPVLVILITSVLLSASTLVIALSISVAVFVALRLNHYLQGTLLHKGLQQVLTERTR